MSDNHDLPDYQQEELGLKEALEYARLDLANYAGVEINRKGNNRKLVYRELTVEELERLAFLASPATRWPADIDPHQYISELAEEADDIALGMGYHGARMAGLALKAAHQPAKAPATTPGKIKIKISEQTLATEPWYFQFAFEASGESYREAYCRIALSQLRAMRAMEATNTDWWGNDTTSTDEAIAIWEKRLAQAVGGE